MESHCRDRQVPAIVVLGQVEYMKFRFDDLTFDTGARALSRQGSEVHLSPKAFRLLEILLRRAPDAVSQEEIYESLWPRTVVNVANLHNLVSQIRIALGAGARSRIRTVYGFGFAFAGEVERSDWRVEALLASFSLLVQLPAGLEDSFLLHHGENLIGSEAGAEVRLSLPSISARHARLTIRVEGVFLEDLASAAGTFVEGNPLKGPVMIEPFTRIQFGQVMARLLRFDSEITRRADRLSL